MGNQLLRRYMYVSTAVNDFSDDELFALANGARVRNVRKSITGVLLYKGGSFLQVIEGPIDAMDELVTRITSDHRHTFLEVLLDEHATRRFFADWEMRLCNLDEGPPPATTEMMNIAKFVTRCKLTNSRPVIDGFIRHFTEESMLFVEDPAA